MQTISANGWTESITKAASLKGLSHLYKKWNRKTRSCRLRVFRFFELMEHLIIFYVHNYNLLRLRSQIIISCDKIEHMCYNMFVASSWARKEVSLLESIFSFIISVVAGIVANYICKWLDGVQKKGNQPKKD